MPSLRPQIIPTSRTLTEVLDAAFRARGESEFVYIRNLGTGDEPGLYYPGIGGARIEDVVHVVSGGNEQISRAPYKWQIA